jgi:hypothetical protein
MLSPDRDRILIAMLVARRCEIGILAIESKVTQSIAVVHISLGDSIVGGKANAVARSKAVPHTID